MMERESQTAPTLAELESRLADLLARWPAHSVSPTLWMEREDLEDEIADLRRRNKESS